MTEQTEASTVTATKEPKPPKAKVTTARPKTEPEKVSLPELATGGELWVKGDVEFDGKTSVQTICLLFPTQGRYLSFNTYNGTYGKKGKKPPIQDVLDGKDEGYAFKNGIEKHREKLTRDGYVKFGEKPSANVEAKPVAAAPAPTPELAAV